MKILRLVVAVLSFLAVSSAFGATVLYTETADKVRFEQYTGGNLVLWRMPTPGVSTFPSGSCTYLLIPGTTDKSSRFIALYMFVKSNSRTYFVQYDTSTCQVVSFGMDG